MLIEPFLLVFREMLLRLVVGVGAVAEYAIVAGQSDRAACALVGSVRVLLQEGVQARYDIEVADFLRSVRLDIMTLDIAVLVEYELVRKAGRLIGMIIAQVVNGEHDCLLPGREHQARVW